MAAKWNINLVSVTQNFQAAKDLYATEDLVGLLFGIPSATIVTNVFFVPASHQLNEAVAKLARYLPSDVVYVGIAKVKGAPTNAEPPAITEFFNVELPLPQLQRRDVRGLSIIRTLAHTESLTIPYSVVLKLSIPLEIETKAENAVKSVKTAWTQWREQLASARIAITQADACIESASDKTTLKKLAKDAKNSVTAPVLRAAIHKDDLERITKAFKATDLSDDTVKISTTWDIVMRLPEEINDKEIYERLATVAERVSAQHEEICTAQGSIVPAKLYSFWLPQSPGLVNIVVPDSPELQKKYSTAAHQLLNVPLERSVLRPSYATKYELEPAGSNRLRNPHEHIKIVQIGQLSAVRGDYLYYHYMQDGFDDCGWGCAYRSFQTVWSWFLLQGYTEKPVPTHREIQQCLVDIGDKQEKFVGSKQWIGSMELSYCLETMMGPSSKILTTNSGADVAEHARALLYHFDNNGCPVMIGGGQLAHTILGVDYNTRSGECRFLVLDPHYTGDECLETVLTKGWCAWKPASFWDKKSFYNLLLPITPSMES
ncbi:Ufm1-specific protease 2 [Aphelenchoides avenae]|nr:Ufm1-specific protease 2 [Aphelenchus avenae]